MTATERCGSHLAVSRSQLSFSEAGQTTTAGIGVVGLERRQRLDRLAEALLVGQEGAPRAQRVADARPLEGRSSPPSTAAVSAIGSPSSRARRGSRSAPRRTRRAARRASPSPSRRWRRRAGPGRRRAPRRPTGRSAARGRGRRRPAARRRRRRRRGPRARRGAGRSRRPSRSRARRAGGGSSPRSSDAMQRCAAPSMRAPPRARRAPRPPLRSSGASSAPSSRSMAPSSSASGTVPARVRRTHQPRPSWRVVVDAADPAALDRGQPGVDLRARGQLGEAVEHLGDVDPGPVVDRRPPLARVPVEAPLRDAAHDGDDVRVVPYTTLRRWRKGLPPRSSRTTPSTSAVAVEAAPVGHRGDEAALALDQLGHRLVDRVGGEQVPGGDRVALADAVAAVLGLVVHRRRPLELEEGDVRRARERDALRGDARRARRSAAGRRGPGTRATASSRSAIVSRAEQVQRVGEALEHRLLDLDVAGEDDERLARGEEVVDPRQRGVQLAARGQALQRRRAAPGARRAASRRSAR